MPRAGAHAAPAAIPSFAGSGLAGAVLFAAREFG